MVSRDWCIGLSIFAIASTILIRWSVIEARGQSAARPSREVRLTDLPAPYQRWFEERKVDAATFPSWIDDLNRRTARRELRGEFDHLIFFVLQSELFTGLRRIEPALSAAAYVNRLSPDERARYLQGSDDYIPPRVRIPEDVETRLRAFIDALMRGHRDPRSDQFRELIGTSLGPGEVPLSLLRNEYARSMRFLYRKEFEPGAVSLYHDRGLSTDTQVEANYAVWGMLSALAAKPLGRPLNRILIVGPGLDLAPRTDLVDVYEPQSFQPFAVADALITLKLADPSALRIECIDVNGRVISFLRDFPRRKQRLLHLFSGLADRQDRPLTAEFKGYFRSLLRGIGREEPPVARPALGARLQKTVLIDQEIARRITASRLDVITERFEPSPGYDLVVATNVLQYFGDAELLLAIANIASMLGDGGFFLHNEARPELAAVTTRLGLPPTQSRTFLIAGTRTNGLFDGAAIHQKVRTPDSSVGPHQ